MSRGDDAWQAALAAEQQAVFAYSVLGPKLAADQKTQVLAFQAAHEKLRDATASAVSAAGLTPVQARVDYPDAYPDARHSALQVAVRLEDTCAAAWRYRFALATPALRPAAQAALTASAVRAARWRQLLDPAHPTVAFPGI